MEIQIGTRTITIGQNTYGPGHKGMVLINITRSPEDRGHNWCETLVGLDFTPEQAIELGNELTKIGVQLGGHNSMFPDICGDCHHYVHDCKCKNSCDDCDKQECPLHEDQLNCLCCSDISADKSEYCLACDEKNNPRDEFDEDTCDNYCCKSCGDEHDPVMCGCWNQCGICDECLYDICAECGEWFVDCECDCDDDDCCGIMGCWCDTSESSKGHEVAMPPLSAFHRARYLKTQRKS